MTLLRISTRQSPLALWQAEHVRAELQARDPDLAVELVTRVTRGDKILDQALSRVGGKDLFVKEIEDALLDGLAELAVHSLKDVPTALPAGLHIVAYPPREDPRDALVSPKGLRFAELPMGARVGTSSLRRAAQLLAARPDLQIVPIRGNVQTRLERTERELDAAVLAHAGLLRLGLGARVTEVLDPALCLPAIGQGILALEVREDDPAANARVAALDHRATRAAALTERSFLRTLEGGCQVPIAGHARVDGDTIFLDGLVAELDGSRIFRGTRTGSIADGEALGRSLGEALIAEGAGDVLARLKASA